MQTNLTYCDNHDLEDCEVFVDCMNVHAVPAVGEMVVLFAIEPDVVDGHEVGKPYIVKERLWTVSEREGDEPVTHITIIVEPHESPATPTDPA